MNRIFEDVTEKLRLKFEKDSYFNKELDNLTVFYGRKLMALTNKESVHEIIENSINNVIRSQVFEGYYVMTTLLNDKEVEFSDKIWELPKGILRNQVRLMLDKMFEDTDYNWTDNEVSNSFALVMLNEVENGFDIAEIITYEVAVFGAYKAIIDDSRYKGPAKDEKVIEMKLGNPFDLEFINEQVYMEAKHYSDQHEIWDLFILGKPNKENSWCGTAHLSTIPLEKDKEIYILSLNLSNVIRDEEKMQIAEIIAKRLPPEITKELQLRLYHTTELQFLGLTSDSEKEQ